MTILWIHIQLLFTYNKFAASKLRLRLGAYYIKRGTGFQVGQPMRLPANKHQPARTLYIANLFYDFRHNTVNHTFSKLPIKGLTEKFVKK